MGSGVKLPLVVLVQFHFCVYLILINQSFYPMNSSPLFRFLMIAFLLIGTGMTSVVQAQEAAPDEEALNARLNSFVEAYQNLTSTKNKQAVLDHFHPDATSNIYVFNISGKSRVGNSTLKGFEGYMDNLLRSSNILNVYQLVGEPMINQFGDIATVTYKVNYEIKVEDGIWVKGNEVVTLAMEKSEEEWLIVHYNIVQIEDEKLKGTCICELFVGEGEDEEVVSKTTVPSGRSYTSKFDNFVFRTTETGEWVIKSPTRSFRRLSTGQLIETLPDGENVVLGIPNSKKETVLMILTEGLYKESCARIKLK